MATQLDATYLRNARAARLLNRNGMAAGGIEGTIAKAFGNEVAHDVADSAMQVMAGIATTVKYPVERIQRDVRAGRFMVVRPRCSEASSSTTPTSACVTRRLTTTAWVTNAATGEGIDSLDGFYYYRDKIRPAHEDIDGRRYAVGH